MAFANSAVTDIIATTIQSRSGVLADNFSNNNALLRRLKSRGKVKPFSGGNVIMQELMYNDATTANVNSYSGFEVLAIGQNSPISAAQYNICQYAAAVTISGLEMLQNSGKEAIIDLLDGRITLAEGQLMNRVANDLYLDGTGNGGKNITGLKAIVPDNGTGTVGGISKTAFPFWANQTFSGVTNGGAAVSAANIVQYMTALAIKMVRGQDKVDLILSDANYYQFYVNALQAIQRVTSEESAGSGFASLKFYAGGMAADVVLDGGIYNGGDTVNPVWSGASANHMYMLNTDYIFWRPHRDRNFVPIGGDRMAVNQDAVVKLIGLAANLCASNCYLQGVLTA